MLPMTPLRILFVAFSALLLSACAKSEPTPEPSTTSAPSTQTAAIGPRIVSTVPAATYNLSLITHRRRHPRRHLQIRPALPPRRQNKTLPIVGDYLNMNYETPHIALHPTAIIVQYAPARVPDRLKRTLHPMPLLLKHRQHQTRHHQGHLGHRRNPRQNQPSRSRRHQSHRRRPRTTRPPRPRPQKPPPSQGPLHRRTLPHRRRRRRLRPR